MSEELHEFDLNISFEWESSTKTIRGARSSLFVPEEPDEITGGIRFGPLMINDEEIAPGYDQDIEDGGEEEYEEEIKEKIIRLLKEHWED